MIFDCAGLVVPPAIMQHVVKVESSGNPYAIGVVGGKLQRQPRNITEAVATARMLEQRGYNFSLGLAQVNRYNLKKYGLNSYEKAFQVCPNLKAGSYILKECYDRAKDWGRSFSCYYSGNFVTGYRHGYVQKIFASMMGKNKNVVKSQQSLVGDVAVQKPIAVSFQKNSNSIGKVSPKQEKGTNTLLADDNNKVVVKKNGSLIKDSSKLSEMRQGNQADLHKDNAVVVDTAFVF
ncbi:lytic transglycosylase domain-containing protein [Neisseria sp. CCUG12390]|uniref:lytic transglycosylase domain-containing protein n=1 Tax=Neisseria sp. CCUG12390 TaxID=3392035 RepID=UPI003A0FBD62